MAELAESRPKNPLRWSIVGLVLGGVLLYATTRKVDLAALLAALRSVDPFWATALVAAQLLFIGLKAWRWGLLLRFVPGIRFNDLHAAVYAGLAVNYVIAHLGEFLRSAAIARRSDAAVSAVLGSVFVERVLDFIALLLFLAMAAMSAQHLPEFVTTAGALTAIVVVVAYGGLFLLLHPPGWVSHPVASVARMLPDGVGHWLDEQLKRFRDGLASIKNVPLMATTVALSVLQWSFVVFLMWASGVAIGESVSFVGATATFVLIVVGLTLPNSPLQIGTNQLAFVIGYSIDGIDATAAVAASFVFTAFALIPTMLIGSICLVQGRLAGFLRLR